MACLVRLKVWDLRFGLLAKCCESDVVTIGRTKLTMPDANWQI